MAWARALADRVAHSVFVLWRNFRLQRGQHVVIPEGEHFRDDAHTHSVALTQIEAE